MNKEQLLKYGNKVFLLAVLFSLLLGCSPSQDSESAQTAGGSTSPTPSRTAAIPDQLPPPPTAPPVAIPTPVPVFATAIAVSDGAAAGSFELCVIRPPRDWTAHVVLNGDKFSTIARLSGATVEEIKRVNCRGGDSAAAGELLYLPDPTANQPEVLPAPAKQADRPAQSKSHQAADQSGAQQSAATPPAQPASPADQPVPQPLPRVVVVEEEAAEETGPATWDRSARAGGSATATATAAAHAPADT